MAHSPSGKLNFLKKSGPPNAMMTLRNDISVLMADRQENFCKTGLNSYAHSGNLFYQAQKYASAVPKTIRQE